MGLIFSLPVDLGYASAMAANGAVYYVSPSGRDSNPGTLERPWKSLQFAADHVNAGNVLYIRGGVYQEYMLVANSGTAAAPIVIQNYPGEQPIVDGNQYTIPNWDGAPLVRLYGDYIHLSGLEVRYSSAVGVSVTGNFNRVERVNAHHNRQNGIVVCGDHNEVSICRVWSNCMSNYGGGSSTGWSAGLSASGLHSLSIYPQDVVLRNNIVSGNWGEGLSTYEAYGTIIEGNTIYDNWSANLYVSDARDVLVQRNFIFASGAMTGGNQVGIMMGDETYSPASANIRVINNIVYHTRRGVYWWQGVQGGGLNNVVIAYNTLVNSTQSAGMVIDYGTHQGVYIQSNIVEQDGDLPVAYVEYHPELHFANNLWSKTPPATVAGAGDRTGDPRLEKMGSPFDPLWFVLLPASPAVNHALPVDGVDADYFGQERGTQPDIGADELSGSVLRHPIFLPLIHGN